MDECLDEYIQTAEDCLRLLQNLEAEIRAHHDNCNAVKTVGTAASVTGGLIFIGSILAAPITGGASIVAAAGIGTAMGLAGGVTNLGTDVVDMVSTSTYSEQVQAIDTRLHNVAERFAKYMDQIEEEAARIHKEKGGSEEDALQAAFIGLVTTGKISWKGKQVGDIVKNVGNTTTSTVLKSGGQVWKGMRLNSNLLASAFKQMGFDVSKRAAFNVVKGTTVVLSAVFIIWDLKSLNDSINSDHPAVELVQTQIGIIEKVLKTLKDLKKSVESSEEDWCVWFCFFFNQGKYIVSKNVWFDMWHSREKKSKETERRQIGSQIGIRWVYVEERTSEKKYLFESTKVEEAEEFWYHKYVDGFSRSIALGTGTFKKIWLSASLPLK